MKFRHAREGETIRLQMTPMIDIVFQLLVFFIMTFKIVDQEGDFNIKMPLSAPQSGPPEVEPLIPMKLRLLADDDGQLVTIALGDRQFESFAQLRAHIRGLFEGDAPGMTRDMAEIELDFDFHLQYRYVVDAITAVSGYLVDGRMVTLVENVKFAPPRE